MTVKELVSILLCGVYAFGGFFIYAMMREHGERTSKVQMWVMIYYFVGAFWLGVYAAVFHVKLLF